MWIKLSYMIILELSENWWCRCCTGLRLRSSFKLVREKATLCRIWKFFWCVSHAWFIAIDKKDTIWIDFKRKFSIRFEQFKFQTPHIYVIPICSIWLIHLYNFLDVESVSVVRSFAQCLHSSGLFHLSDKYMQSFQENAQFDDIKFDCFWRLGKIFHLLFK